MKVAELITQLNTMINIIRDSDGSLSRLIKIAVDNFAYVDIDWSDVAIEDYIETYDELENLFIVMNSELNCMEEKIYA